MVKCQTCNATYEPIQADLTRYFHACPPLNVRELKDAIDKGAIVLSPAHRAQLDAARARDLAVAPAKDQTSQEDLVLSLWSYPRPNHRDDNILIGAIDKRPAVVVSVGKGEPILVP